MTQPSNKSQLTTSKLDAVIGIDDDMLSGVVGGAGTPGAVPTKHIGSADDHLHALSNALHIEPIVVHHHLGGSSASTHAHGIEAPAFGGAIHHGHGPVVVHVVNGATDAVHSGAHHVTGGVNHVVHGVHEGVHAGAGLIHSGVNDRAGGVNHVFDALHQGVHAGAHSGTHKLMDTAHKVETVAEEVGHKVESAINSIVHKVHI